MGCFNMRCAVTGVPITVGTDVVVFRLGVDERRIHRTNGENYAICSLPRFGSYNDYGFIDHEAVDQRFYEINQKLDAKAKEMRLIGIDNENWIDESMFILREVYDYITDVDYDNKQSWVKDCETVAQERQEAKEDLERSLHIWSEANKEEDNLMNDLLLRNIFKGKLQDIYRVMYIDQYVWSDVIYDDREVGEIYYKSIYPIWTSTRKHHWEIMPSAYAGQSIDFDELITVRKISMKYLAELKKEYEE